jgi:hypothetical protein
MTRIVRPRSARRAAAVLSAVALAWLVSGAQGGPAAAAPGGHRPAPAHPAATGLSSPAGTGASDVATLGAGGWAVQSSRPPGRSTGR